MSFVPYTPHQELFLFSCGTELQWQIAGLRDRTPASIPSTVPSGSREMETMSTAASSPEYANLLAKSIVHLCQFLTTLLEWRRLGTILLFAWFSRCLCVPVVIDPL